VARLLLWPLLFIVLLNGWLYLRQPNITFYPFAELEATPAEWGLPYEEVHIQSGDGPRLHGWYLPQPEARNTLLFLHGNGGNISHRRDSLVIFHRLGLSVLIVDYRGYGRSEGEPDEAGLYRDAMAAWDYLTGQLGIDGNNIIIFGRSLGGRWPSTSPAEFMQRR
jgi:pimeloyl-ACP methyl ester carboxylesterase